MRAPAPSGRRGHPLRRRLRPPTAQAETTEWKGGECSSCDLRLLFSYAALPGHGGNPVANQCKALEVYGTAPLLRHHDAGLARAHAERQDGILWVSRHNVENMIAGAAARRHRRFANSQMPIRGRDRFETQARRVRRPRGAMAVRAIDI